MPVRGGEKRENDTDCRGVAGVVRRYTRRCVCVESREED